MRNTVAFVAGIMTVAVAGCSQPKATALNYKVMRLSGATQEAVFDAATRALGEYFTVHQYDPAAGILEGAAPEEVSAGGSKRLRDVVAMPRRERRVAHMRVESAESTVKVFCKVLVQICDTPAHQMYDREHALHDLPTDTPAQRGAAATTEQNSVWRNDRRDKRLESQILRAVREQVAGADVL